MNSSARVAFVLLWLVLCAFVSVQLMSAPSMAQDNLLANGSFEQGLDKWKVTTRNAAVKARHTAERWNTYSLTFNTKKYKRVYFYISVSPDMYTGGTVWIDNIRAEGIKIENPSFERTLADGTAPGWEYMFKMYNKMKRHAKETIGTDFQYASDGVLSMRFFAPRQRNIWKLARVPEPKALAEGWKPPGPMPGWRPLVEAEMLLWQVLDVKPNTQYTIQLDYRMSSDFNGVVRPAVGGSLQPWHLLAHAGWTWTEFKELQQLRKRFGKSLVSVTTTNGEAGLAQDVHVKKGATLHAYVDVATERRNTGKPLEMTARLALEDATTGKLLAEDRFVWDGTPGHTEGMTEKGQVVEGESTELRVTCVCPSDTIRLRLSASGRGEPGTMLFGNVELTKRPHITPPVQKLRFKGTRENFHIVGDALSYRVVEGDAKSIEGALWLAARDLKRRGIDFRRSDKIPDVSICIGGFSERGDEGYRLGVTARGVRIEAASPRAAQYALMTLVQLVGYEERGKFITGVDITDWPDMPVRGVVMEDCSHFMPQGPNPVRLVDCLSHGNPRQTWCREDFLQLVRWKFNTVFWRGTGLSDQLMNQCRRFHLDSMAFVSTISDAPTNAIFVKHPEWIEGVYVQDEKHALKGFQITRLANANVIRDKTTDIVVTSADKKTTYKLGKDYRVTGEMGQYKVAGHKMVGGKPFGVARVKGSRIPDGATVLVSYDYIDKGKTYSWHTQYCPSHPDAVAYVGKAVKDVASRWKTKYLHIRGDELTHVNSDSRCKKRGLKPCDLLLKHLDFIVKKAHEGNPSAQVVMWHDAFSPYAGGYHWAFTEEGPSPPSNVWQMVWYYDPGRPSGVGWATLKYNERYGLSSIVLPWFDLEAIREWAQVVGEARRRGWKCLGIMDVPWGHPNPYPNFRETSIVSWKVPRKGEKRWLKFEPPENE